MEKARVYLVGAGPGDPDLLTVKAARLISAADVVVHDGLVDAAIMALISPSARLISVAKSRSRHSVPQDGINDILVREAQVGRVVVRLKGGDKIGSKLTTFITQLPKYGSLFQLSQVYSLYGYHPVSGVPITHNHTLVTGSLHRVYYVPNTRLFCRFCSDVFSFIVTDGLSQSFPGNVTMVDADGTIVGSDFLLGNDGWTILGNKLPVSLPVFEPYSRDKFFHHYIQASDNLVHGKPDKYLWVFNAPSKFLGNFGIAYGGTIHFSISLLAGDVTQLHKGAPLVELECNKTGITLVYPLSAVQFYHLIFKLPWWKRRVG